MIGVTASDRGHRLRITHTRRRGWLSIRQLIVLDLAVATFKVAKGIAPPPTWGMFHYISELHS